MRVAVVGSRSFADYAQLENQLNLLQNVQLIVSGGAQGADQLAEKWAKSHGIKTLVFQPDWDTYGKSAGPIRNRNIVNNADIVVAFWDGISKGTRYTLDFAHKKGLEVRIVRFDSI